MNEYNLRKLILSSPELDANEKVLLFALCFRLNWETWSGPVSVSNLAALTSNSERTVRRVLSKLKDKEIILRTSTREKGSAKSRVALTRINLSFFSKHDKVVSDKVVSDKVVPLNHDKVVPLNHDNIDPHTIGNNINKQYINPSLVTPEREEEAWRWGGLDDTESYEEEEEREINQVYTFTYPSSILDPQERLEAENHVKANWHRLTHADRERIMYPDLTKPLI